MHNLTVASIVCLLLGFSHSSGAKWNSCPEYIGYLSPDNVNVIDHLECRNLKVPLEHGSIDGGEIDVLLMRSIGLSDSKKGQIWFLLGGPGESVASYAYPLYKWASAHPQYDYYAMEHRGTGASTPLLCEEEEASAACYEELLSKWGSDGLSKFSTNQAAHDLFTAMEETANGTPRLLYGFSYGTFLAQRFSNIYKNMVDGLILDGVVPAAPDENNLHAIDSYDYNFHQLALKIAVICDKSRVCSEKIKDISSLTTSTADLIADTFTAVDEGSLCEALKSRITRKQLRNISAELIRNWNNRMLYPAMFYRINRCSSSDLKALENLFPSMVQADSTSVQKENYPLSSENLNTNIIVSELIGGKDFGTVKNETETFHASPDETLNQYTKRDMQGWQTYAGFTSEWPNTDASILLMNGAMDPQTTIEFARRAKEHYTGSNQYLVEFSTSPHGTLLYSLLEGVPLEEVDTCGSRIFFDFIESPTTKPDTSCLDNVIAPDFDGVTEEAKATALNIFQSESFWE